MIKKIICGGQKGAERAALDAARKLYIDYSGWIPLWRAEEDECLIKDYHLQTFSSGNYVQAAEQNVMESEGTLIIGHGQLAGSAALNRRLAERYQHPWIYIDLQRMPQFKACQQAAAWISERNIEILNITGPASVRNFDIYQTVMKMLETIIQMTLADFGRYGTDPFAAPAENRLDAFMRMPKTVDEAVSLLLQSLTFHDQTRIANMAEERLEELIPSLGTYIKNEYRLWQGNEPLMRHCREKAGEPEVDPAAVIIKSLWENLQDSQTVLRVVK